jgi:hypothetical protein
MIMNRLSRVAVSVEHLAALTLIVAASACGSSSSEGPFTDGGPGSSNDNDASSPPGSQGDDDAGNNSGNADTGTVSGVLAVPLTSCVPLVYAANVDIGGETFQLLVDTGSTSLGVAGKGCTNCSVTPLYTPSATSTDEKTTATSQFGSGSWSGEVYQDQVGFGSDPSVPVNFVAITSQTSFFQQGSTCGGQPYQGIIGFDRALAEVKGTDGFFDQFVAGKGVANVFATQLCDNGGTLWLGGFDSSFTTGAMQYTPVTTDAFSSAYYTVNLASITVGSTTVPVASAAYPDSVLDTGTSAFLLGSTAFDALTAAIGDTAGFKQLFGDDAGAGFFNSQQPCANLTQTKAQLDAILPPLTMTFGSNPGITVQALATESYLMPYPSFGWCSSLASQPQSADEFPLASIVGSPVLRSNVVVFDRAKGQIGFAPHKACAGE